MKLRILLFAAVVSLLFCIPALSVRATHGFRLGKMALDLYSNPAWDVAPPSLETLSTVQQMLNRPLRYLSHGAQSFVFETEDRQFIVKLFRYDQRVHPWREWLRSHLLGKPKRLRHDEKIHRLFVAAKIAYEKAPDLTGLYYVHLNQTHELLPTAHLIDRLGRSYHLDMNRYRFAIQHHARPFQEVVQEAIATKDVPKCERLLASFASLLNERGRRQIRNSDTKVAPNFGFWGETAIEWDFGNYWIDPQMQSALFRQFEREQFAFQVRNFLNRFAPEYISYFNRQLEEK
jgi:hypothetical protein